MLEALAILGALAEPIAKILELATADDYDQEAERQAFMDLQSAIYDERLKRALSAPR